MVVAVSEALGRRITFHWLLNVPVEFRTFTTPKSRTSARQEDVVELLVLYCLARLLVVFVRFEVSQEVVKGLPTAVATVFR